MHPQARSPTEVPVQACPRKPGKWGCKEDFLKARLRRVEKVFRLDAWVRVNAGQRSEVRWEGQRVQAASNPLPGPDLLPLLCLELLGPASPLSSPHSLHFSEKIEAPVSLPPTEPVSLSPGLSSSDPPEIDPTLCWESWLHLSSPLQSELGPLSLWLPPLSLQGPPKEEHLESLVSPQMSSGEGVPARPLLLHTPPLLHPPTCPVFSLIRSSQYLVSWDVLDPPAAPTQSLCLCPPPQALPHLLPPLLAPQAPPQPLCLLTLIHTPATCYHPRADVTSPCLYANFSPGFCSAPQHPTASWTQHSQHCSYPSPRIAPSIVPSLIGYLSSHPTIQGRRAALTSPLSSPSLPYKPLIPAESLPKYVFPFPSFSPHHLSSGLIQGLFNWSPNHQSCHF